MNKATRRPHRTARISKSQRAQLRKEAQQRMASMPNKSYLKGVEGCTYKPLKIATNAAHGRPQLSELSWRDNGIACK